MFIQVTVYIATDATDILDTYESRPKQQANYILQETQRSRLAEHLTCSISQDIRISVKSLPNSQFIL